MCVTHEPKVAAKCSRVLFIVDGGIMGEKMLGSFDSEKEDIRDRERDLNNWLMELGW
jgi:putative ABC transport system ATP-binding protein